MKEYWIITFHFLAVRYGTRFFHEVQRFHPFFLIWHYKQSVGNDYWCHTCSCHWSGEMTKYFQNSSAHCFRKHWSFKNRIFGPTKSKGMLIYYSSHKHHSPNFFFHLWYCYWSPCLKLWMFCERVWYSINHLPSIQVSLFTNKLKKIICNK
jgi:hypothetical protein